MEPEVVAKLDAFFSHYIYRKLQKHEIVLRSGDDVKGILYLKKGHVRQFVVSKDGEDITLNVYKSGAFFPMSLVVHPNVNIYSFEVMDDAEAWIAPKEDVLAFIKKEPDVLFDLLQRVYSGLEGIMSRMEHLMSGSAAQRLVAVLVISAKRFGTHQAVDSSGDTVEIGLKLTHEDLAGMAGLSRETVSREMMQLKQQGLITYTGTSMTIPNLEALETHLM